MASYEIIAIGGVICIMGLGMLFPILHYIAMRRV